MRVRWLFDRRFGLILTVAALIPLIAVNAVAQGADVPEGAPRVTPHASGDTATGTPGAVPQSAPATQTVKELVAAAKAGNVDAQLKIGLAYLLIKPPNVVEALKWLRAASDRGNSLAAYNIGLLYANGNPKNPVEAAKWYRVAADRGNAAAQNSLGVLYDSGQGVPQDFAEAAKWFRLAADQKNAAGESNLGALYAGGRGVPLDHDEAVRLFRLAANQGFAVAQANLGFQYQTGHGVPASPAAAYFWLNLAAAALPANMTALRTRVTQARDVVSGQLAPDELQHVQEMAVSWKPGSTGVPADGVPTGITQSTSAPIAGAPSGATKARSSGTGFVINHAGFVLTNNHVVGQCSEVRGRHGADPVGVLSVVAKDAQNDLALLKLAAHFPDAAVFREERGVRQGDSIVVYGFPLAGGLAAQGNLTTGTISALAGFGNDSRMLQLTAPVQPGNSGGPVLDAGGNVLGILSGGLDALRIATAVGTLPQNVNFAIKGSVARNFLDANGIDYQIAPIKNELKPADIGDRAKRFTLYIECWR